MVDFVDRWQTDSADWGTPSFFELTFAMAMDEFERQGCDIVVLETGMGGGLVNQRHSFARSRCHHQHWVGYEAFLGTDIRSIARGEREESSKKGCLSCWGRCARMPNLNCWQRR